MCSVAGLGRVACAQLTPDRVYYGVDRSMPMTVAVPEGAEGEVSIRLLSAPSAQSVEEAAAAEGGVDLATLFPSLWTEKRRSVVWAQLYVGDVPVGAGVVLQPMISPDVAELIDPRTGAPAQDPRSAEVYFESDMLRAMFEQNMVQSPDRRVTYSGIRAWADRNVVLETSAGEIVIRTRPDAAPNTSFNFIQLAEGGLYTGIEVHRVVAALPNGAPFVIQAGDPTGTGAGGPGFFVDLEKSNLPHDYGVVSMARSSSPNSNGSQFFICLSREGTAFLDGRYTAFGQVISGADAVTRIAGVEVGEGDRPVEPPVIESARTVPAAPYGTGPAPITRATAGER